jgi:hypothetical protein
MAILLLPSVCATLRISASRNVLCLYGAIIIAAVEIAQEFVAFINVQKR